MSYFDSLLESRGLEQCPLPLWKLKLTDEEYNDLKELLVDDIDIVGQRPFFRHAQEACLFFAEFWRREYVEGPHSKEMVYKALNTTPRNRKRIPDLIDSLYQAAQRGAKILKIETFKPNQPELNDLLYQGGLPMNKVYTPETNSVWDKFTTGLVFRNIDFDDLDLGIIAKNHKGLREFCNVLCDAVDKKQFMLMPYYCESELDNRYQYMLQKFTAVKRARRQSKPFGIEWEFQLSGLDESMSIKFKVSGPQTLSDNFLEQNHLKGQDFITINIFRNSSNISSFDYINNFCRYEVVSKHPYAKGDIISVNIEGHEKPILSQTLDLNTPQLLYQLENGKYQLGNRIGSSASVILIPNDWEIENEENYTIKIYRWSNDVLRGILLPEDFTGEVTVSGKDGKLNFSSNTSLYWTENDSKPLDIPLVNEQVFNAADSTFKMCYQDRNGDTKRINRPVQFRSKRTDQWSYEAPYGEVYARSVDKEGGFVTPTSFINVGDELLVRIVEADENSCKIKIRWPHGKVFTPFGQGQIDDIWYIRKSDCKGNRFIPFEFTPTHDHQNAFSLNIKPPFKMFSISDENGKDIEFDAWVPFTELERYQYHVAGMNIEHFSVGDKEYRLKWNGNDLSVIPLNNPNSETKRIPYSGSLLQLLGSREDLRLMLDRTSQKFLRAQIPVVFNLPNGKKRRLFVKESPFLPCQKGNTITILGNHKKELVFTRPLKLFKIKDPEAEPLLLYYDPEKGYKLPEEIKDWDGAMVTGRTRGRIRPRLVRYALPTEEESVIENPENFDIDEYENTQETALENPNQEEREVKRSGELTNEERIRNRLYAIKKITEDIEKATLGDETWKRIIGWFIRTRREDLPASSFLDLQCTANDSVSLIKLAFQLYCETNNNEQEREKLTKDMMYFSKDLAFQWFWLLPQLKNVVGIVNGFIPDLGIEAVKNLYIRRVLEMPENQEYLKAILNPSEYTQHCFTILFQEINDFTQWMRQLCRLSLEEVYEKNNVVDDITNWCIDNIINNTCTKPSFTPNYFVEINQNKEQFADEVKNFFKKYFKELQKEDKRKFSYNEAWFLTRVFIISQHLTGKIDIFNQLKDMNESHAEEIRRSLIFCFKSTQPNFVFNLNQKLAH